MRGNKNLQILEIRIKHCSLNTGDSSSKRKNLDTNIIKTSLLKTLCKQKAQVQGKLN